MTASQAHDGDAERLARLGVLRLRAENPSPLTLSGTNTWVVGGGPAWVIDPGPPLAEHLERIVAAVRERGGLAGILLTHDHSDHAGAVPRLRAALDAPLAAARPAGKGDLTLSDGNRHGPFEVIATPGHAPDHLAYIYERVCFTGDAVLGEGSVFIAPDPGALSGYLAALERLQARELDVLCPGHGPPVWEARAKLDSYIAHRLERESRLLAALASGLRQPDELLDAAWTEIPRRLRPAAAFTLAAHLDKLDEEGRLPADVVRPATPDLLGSA